MTSANNNKKYNAEKMKKKKKEVDFSKAMLKVCSKQEKNSIGLITMVKKSS